MLKPGLIAFHSLLLHLKCPYSYNCLPVNFPWKIKSFLFSHHQWKFQLLLCITDYCLGSSLELVKHHKSPSFQWFPGKPSGDSKAIAFWLLPWGPNWSLFWLEAMLLIALSRIRHCLRPAYSILTRSSSSAFWCTAVHPRGCTAGDVLHTQHSWKEGVNSWSAAAWLLNDLVSDPTSASELGQVLLAPPINRLLRFCLGITPSLKFSSLAVTQMWLYTQNTDVALNPNPVLHRTWQKNLVWKP